jgi:ElaB/YqjD/DUF883 family membrane-anchored ribosome-binding protein
MSRDQVVMDAEVGMNEFEKVASTVGERTQAFREKAAAALRTGRAAAKTTDTWVHDHPWSAIGMAAGVGCVIGWLVARR